MVLPVVGQEAVATQLRNYAERYSGTPDAQKRIRLANDFFSYLQKIDYLDESVVFPNDAHIDSVDVNVYYYIAEWYYGDGQYSQATAYCSRAAEACSETLGVTPQVYFTQVRMKKAKYLLLNYRDITVNEVAEKCGYTLMTNFTRAFARYYGIKPSEVRLQKPDTEITPPHGEGRHSGKQPIFADPIDGAHE